MNLIEKSIKTKFYRNIYKHLFSFITTFLIINSLIRASTSDVIDQFARQGRALIFEAAIPGGKIRQCTCQEQSECVNEMKKQAMTCLDDGCWSKFSTLTQHPNDLRKCFAGTDSVIEDFITCFEHNVDACLAQRSEVMIQKINISKIFELGVERIRKTKNQLTKNLAAPIKKIIDTAADFGVCVKDCFLAKNKGSFCFDRERCQPLLLDKKAKNSLRRCTSHIDWKKEAGELCECSVNAGLNQLQQYCPMLRLISNGSRQRSSST